MLQVRRDIHQLEGHDYLTTRQLQATTMKIHRENRLQFAQERFGYIVVEDSGSQHSFHAQLSSIAHTCYPERACNAL